MVPNNLVQQYTFDAASQLKTLTYKKTDNSIIEQIAYDYDARGQRIGKNTINPAPAAQETPYAASYDAADRMTAITLKGTGANNTDETFNLSYNNLDNLIEKRKADNSDVTTYTWDARNRLTGITKTGANPINASFKYDELGRRIERTINNDTTRYVYDGSQAILEIRATETANILTGIGIDEVLARYVNGNAAANRTYLADALGSVIGLAKEDQSVTTQLGYSPYGETAQTGEANTNSNQYTARENDGTGLYYYRARYYDPVLKRFIAEDPIGLAGGINRWGYVGGDPVSLSDPEGKDITVNLYSGAGGFGHIGLGVNSSATSGFYPKDGGGNPLTGATGEVKQDDAAKLEQSLKIPATTEQDALVQACIARREKSAGKYTLTGNNCRAFVDECLREAALTTGGRGPGPRPYFEDLLKQRGKP